MQKTFVADGNYWKRAGQLTSEASAYFEPRSLKSALYPIQYDNNNLFIEINCTLLPISAIKPIEENNW
jgi:hypothetical protein